MMGSFYPETETFSIATVEDQPIKDDILNIRANGDASDSHGLPRICGNQRGIAPRSSCWKTTIDAFPIGPSAEIECIAGCQRLHANPNRSERLVGSAGVIISATRGDMIRCGSTPLGHHQAAKQQPATEKHTHPVSTSRFHHGWSPHIVFCLEDTSLSHPLTRPGRLVQ